MGGCDVADLSTRRRRSLEKLLPALVVAGIAIPLAAAGGPAIGRAQSGCATTAVGDEFEGPAGTPPNPALWNHQLAADGAHGQHWAYTNFPSNASLDGNGNLAITALRQDIPIPGGVLEYTSARLHTQGHLDLCTGRLAARMKFPPGQLGLRPTFFLLGSDCATVGWPECGEVDVMEQAIGLAGSTMHGPGYDLPVGAPLDVSDDWHEYWMRWAPDNVVVGIDGQEIATWTPASLPPGTAWIFNNRPMSVILTVNVGGPGGPPDASTQFPTTLLVDWLRYTPG
jgi:beta-glucanase (GH16 family)